MASVWNRWNRLAIGVVLVSPLSGAAQVAAPAANPATSPAGPAAQPGTRPAPPASKPVRPEDILPSMADLHLLFEQEKYTDLMKHMPRLLTLRGKAAEPYNKWELYMLKFEAHMKLKATAPALATLRDASEITDDATRLAWCKSVELLIRRSKNFLYQPQPMRKEKPPAIDIIDAENRKMALKALLTDELTVVKPRVDKALDSRSMVAIADAVSALQGFDVLELAAGGGTDESKQMIAELRTRGIALMAKTVIAMQANQTQIDKNANELIRYVVNLPNFNGGFTQQVRYRKRGLENREYNDLKEMIRTTEQIIPNARGLAKATGGQVREVEDLITAAEDLLRKAERTLNADYSDTN